MISADLRARIRRLFYAEHWKIGTIAAELGVHRDTVALAVEVERFTNVAFRPTATVLDPYKDFVRATLEQHPRLRATRLLQMIEGAATRARSGPFVASCARSGPVARTKPSFGSRCSPASRGKSTGAASAPSSSARRAGGSRAS